MKRQMEGSQKNDIVDDINKKISQTIASIEQIKEMIAEIEAKMFETSTVIKNEESPESTFRQSIDAKDKLPYDKQKEMANKASQRRDVEDGSKTIETILIT